MFGDSYSATGYLGSQAEYQPGAEGTRSSSLAWPQHFVKYCSANALLFDFAQAGATTNRTLVNTNVLSFEEQINTFNIHSREIGWEAANSLFVLFIGINVSEL